VIPQSFIQELLARVDIVDVVERFVPLKKAGANFQACCPFHSEKTPSFTVSPSKQFYHCFGCGAHGSAIGFLMEYSGLNYPDAIEDLASRLGIPVPEEKSGEHRPRMETASLTAIMAQATAYYREQLKASPPAIEYLKGRGLTGEIAARFGLGYAPAGWQNLEQVFPDYSAAALLEAGLVTENEAGKRYDRFRERIMFPIIDTRGNVIGFGGRILAQEKGDEGPKYLNSPETPLFEKGRELYGLPQARAAIRDSGTVIVVEGYMDVVALAQHGIGNAVATLGTATTPNHVHKLLRQAERIVFCFDGDNAGRKAAWRALEASVEQIADDKFAGFVFLPAEHDPDSFVRQHGAAAFDELAQRSVPLTEFLLRELKSQTDLTTAEGRSRLLHEAKPLLLRLNAPLLRLQLIKALAETSGFSQAEIEALCGLKTLGRMGGAGRGNRSFDPRPIARQAISGHEYKLLRLVLLDAVRVAQLPQDLPLGDSAEAHALRALINAFDEGTLHGGNLAALNEHFRGTPQETIIAKITGELVTENVDETTLEAEFNDTIEGMRLASLTREINMLNKKADNGGLTEAEKLQRGHLLARKQKLMSSQRAIAPTL